MVRSAEEEEETTFFRKSTFLQNAILPYRHFELPVAYTYLWKQVQSHLGGLSMTFSLIVDILRSVHQYTC